MKKREKGKDKRNSTLIYEISMIDMILKEDEKDKKQKLDADYRRFQKAKKERREKTKIV